MKKYIALFTLLVMFPLGVASAQGIFMMGRIATTTDDHTAQEEAEGKDLWGKIKAGTLACGSVTDGQFDSLGEYFMGQMTGDAHVVMNQRITQMMGSEAETAMHVVLGKRLSGCDKNAAFPAGSENFMMPMMGGWSDTWTDQGGSSPWGNNDNFNHMYGGYHYLGMGGFGWFGGILSWILIIVGLVFLIKILRGKGGSFGKNATDILKERYAKGEIDKAEFEAKKKDLS